jgi:hypothetical protein
MPELLQEHALLIALLCAAAAITVTAAMGWLTWKRWQRLSLVRRAAQSLIDVHAARLDEAVALASEQVGTLADDGEQLAVSLEQLRADVDHARWLLDRIPTERDRFMHELGELLLPTAQRERATSDR